MAFVLPFVATTLASAALNIALAWAVGPSKTANFGEKLNLPDVQTSNYGIAIATVRGQARVAGNVIWQSDIKERAVTTTTSISGGLLKPSSQVSNTTYLYSCSLAVAICGHEIVEVTRIWADDVLIYDAGDPASESLSTLRCTIYTGTETQLCSPLIESIDGVGTSPAYRGMAYVTFGDFDLGAYGNRLPRFMFEVEGL
jgi:hypothetical protein